MSTSLPLSGIRVVDMTQVMLGPCGTQVLGDYGADVIKIERPGSGDLMRWALPDDPDGSDNPVFGSLNRNKRSLALDLKSDEGHEILIELLRKADVVANNFRAGVMERMGLSYERLTKINPGLIYAVGTGFGRTGPNAHKGGQDILAQAVSGAMARRSNPDDPLSVYPTALADYAAGMHLVQAILLALLERHQTGRGQTVEVSLYDSMLAMQMQEASMWLMREHELNWGAMPLSGVFSTADGALVMVGAFKRHPLRDISTALGIDDLSWDPRFDSMGQMIQNRGELQTIFRERFAQQNTAYWIEALEAQDLLCAPVRSLGQALADEQTAVNDMVIETTHATGSRLRAVATPIVMNGVRTRRAEAAPQLGEHSDAILAELDYDADSIAALRLRGVVA